MTEKPNFSPLLCQNRPWVSNDNNIWLGSSISISRNIDKFKFPGKLDTDKRKQIISLISKELTDSNLISNPKVIKADEISHIEKEFLVEHFLTQQSFHQAHTGEGFIIDDTGEFIATINLQDHLQLLLIDCKGELENAWERLVKIETAIGKSINYAFSPRFGFLTADPNQCGTGLVVHVFLQLTGLILAHQLEETIGKYKDESLTVRGLQGSPTDFIGDLIVFNNNYTLGLTEENIISSIRNFTTRLMVAEKSARSYIKSIESSDIKDKVSRAYAILIHSYQIEAVEALNSIALLKFGLDLGWLTGTTQAALTELFFNCRRAHLLCHFAEKISQEEIAHKRAEFIHRSLKNVELHI